MFLQKLIQYLYPWEVRLGVILSMSIQIILVLFGSRRKISKAIWLKILLWFAYVCADAVAIFSLGLLAQNKEESRKNDPLLNHQLRLLWVPLLILHLGGPDTITAYSLEDNSLWLRHLLNLVIQVGVALYAIVKSWNKHNPLAYLVIPIFVSGAIKYYERTAALKSASFEQIFDNVRENVDLAATPRYFTVVHRFLLTLTHFFSDEFVPSTRFYVDQGQTILEKKSSDAFRLVEDELGLMYDLLYTKASMIYYRLGIYLRCLYLVSSVATLTAFVIIHKHKHNESTWPYPLSDVLITYFLMIGAVILEIYAAILVVLSDWTLIRLEKHQNNNTFAKFLFGKIFMYRGVLLSEKRWSRSLKQFTIDRSPTALKRIEDWFFGDSLFRVFVPSRWREKDFEFEYVSEAGDDAEQMMKGEVFKVIKHWFDVSNLELGSNRELENMSVSNFIYESMWKGTGIGRNLLPNMPFSELIFSWYIVTNRLHEKPGEDTEESICSCSHSRPQYDYNKSSKYLCSYLMYLVWFHKNMLPPGNYKLLCDEIFQSVRAKGIAWEKITLEPWSGKGKFVGKRVLKLANSLTNYFDEMRGCDPNTIPAGFNNEWEIMSSVWAHLLVYAAASQSKWVEHAQHLRRGGEFLTHVAVLFAHASTAQEHQRAKG